MPRDMTIAAQLRRVPSAVRPTVKAARGMVKAIAPKAREVAYQSKPPGSTSAMWKLGRYVVGDEYVVGIGTFPAHATLFFYRGRELDDGSGLLEGGGKQFRSITLRAPSDAERPAVKRLVRKAFALARDSERGATV